MSYFKIGDNVVLINAPTGHTFLTEKLGLCNAYRLSEKSLKKIQRESDDCWKNSGTYLEEFAKISEESFKNLQNASGGIPVVNSSGGVKNFGGKPEPRLLFQSMPEAVLEVIKVLTYGAKKYSPDNWKLVEESAYHDAFQRHYLDYCKGEKLDSESDLPHIAHMIASLFFILQKNLEKQDE